MQGARLLLYPFSVVYDAVTGLRNWGFNKGFLRSTSYDIPIIAVGNLSTGGTGKTPMIEYLIRHLADRKIAVLSRGYGRDTKGYRLVEVNDTARQVGDEPLQFKQKFVNITVAVCEKRKHGIDQILKNHDVDVILLDDAFQHRYVTASQYVLLTNYNKPYYNDFVLPAGDLRESRRGARRAHIVIVTKCPQDLTEQDQQSIAGKLSLHPDQQLFFTTIAYSDSLIDVNGKSKSYNAIDRKNVVVVTGIAHPETFTQHISEHVEARHLSFPDHYAYQEKDVIRFKEASAIITTEKDFMRLQQFQLENLYYLPIEVKFIGEQWSPSISDNL
jgi:tetraacyldisaccharide 4'-kinase